MSLLAVDQVRSACYQSGSRWMIWLGIALIAIGLVLFILSVPLWVYLALAGIVLIIIGIMLLRQ